MAGVVVTNLFTDESREYVGIAPHQAVIAAYAQERADWNTWDYQGRYAHLLIWGQKTVACGDWCARRE